MQAVMLIVALSLPGQVEPPPRVPSNPRPEVPKLEPVRPELAKPDPSPMVEPPPKIFSLDELAAGAKNDAFVDEFLKDKELTLFGQVQKIERFVEPDNDTEPPKNPRTTYRVLMQRLGHEDRVVDINVYFVFTAAARKDLALLEPGITKVTVQGTCAATQLQMLERGLTFTLELRDCEIVETPMELKGTPATPRTPIIPNVIPDNAPPLEPAPRTVPPPVIPAPAVPAPVPAVPLTPPPGQ